MLKVETLLDMLRYRIKESQDIKANHQSDELATRFYEGEINAFKQVILWVEDKLRIEGL